MFKQCIWSSLLCRTGTTCVYVLKIYIAHKKHCECNGLFWPILPTKKCRLTGTAFMLAVMGRDQLLQQAHIGPASLASCSNVQFLSWEFQSKDTHRVWALCVAQLCNSSMGNILCKEWHLVPPYTTRRGKNKTEIMRTSLGTRTSGRKTNVTTFYTRGNMHPNLFLSAKEHDLFSWVLAV